MPDHIDFEAKSERDILIMLVGGFNQLVDTNKEIVKRLDRGQTRMDETDKSVGKLELWQAGMLEWKKKVNGNGVRGMSKKTKAAIASAGATVILVGIEALVRVLSKTPG